MRRRAQALCFLACVTLADYVHSQTFRHPGILLGRETIDDTKKALARRDAVKTAALDSLIKSPLASLDYKANPHKTVVCGPYSKPDIGCTDEVRDAQAAYAHALLWAYLGDRRHARLSVDIMDAWMDTLSGGHANLNAPLQAAWAAQLWTRAAEIIRHTSTVWPTNRSSKFGDWLIKQYLRDIDRMGACYNGNWHASAIEARLNIGVYTDRRDVYNLAVRQWRQQLPAYIYMTRDGQSPRMQPGCGRPINTVWFDQKRLVSGHSQELCRDLGHTAFGLAAFINAAETNRLQGGSLYREERERLEQAMEFTTNVLIGEAVPTWLCNGKLKSSLSGTLEIGYAQLHGRMGRQLPSTGRWLTAQRPAKGQLHFLWETLTHGIPIPP